MPSTDITSYSYFNNMYDFLISFELSYLNIRVITQPTIRAPTHPGGVRLSPHTVSTSLPLFRAFVCHIPLCMSYLYGIMYEQMCLIDIMLTVENGGVLGKGESMDMEIIHLSTIWNSSMNML